MKKALCVLMAFVLPALLAACAHHSADTNRLSEPFSSDGERSRWATAAAVEEDWRYVEKTPTEEYDDTDESPFKDVATSPLSTFSSDVDTASYSNMRRFINSGQKPIGVRIEELVNYFSYDYPAPLPDAEHPFTITTEVAPCPWNSAAVLAMIGIQGATLKNSGDIANNIVFLVDVSGSMSDANKLPLLRESFKLMVPKLSSNDVVSIVTYAGSNTIVADSIPGDKRDKLLRLFDQLKAGGSTAGAAGIRTAYALAEKNYIKGGNNRIILATDGDFNVGLSSVADLTDIIEKEREKGIFISVLGFGMYNLKDRMMETIADKGNGNYAYIDNLREARKVLVDEFDATLFTIAKDLKIQVEFNPGVVAQYRLIGYNNRRMENEDFNDDKKDAGDVGAGHSVTAFYELVLVGGKGPANVDQLKYQKTAATGSTDYMNVKVRYKLPGGDVSRLVEHAVMPGHYSPEMSDNFGFASAVAEFGLLLTDSKYAADSNLEAVGQRALRYEGQDPYGLRAEFVTLVKKYQKIVD